jgi:hypothetical protein
VGAALEEGAARQGMLEIPVFAYPRLFAVPRLVHPGVSLARCTRTRRSFLHWAPKGPAPFPPWGP